MKRYTWWFFLCLLCSNNLFSTTYKAHLSSSWYPLKKHNLQELLEQQRNRAQEKYQAFLSASDIRALIVPHAGYEYSGVIASSAYRLISAHSFSRVIILAPSHFSAFNGVVLPDKDYTKYKSPLGELAFDTRVLNALAKEHSDLFTYNHRPYEVEHSVEVQIPFIQQYVGQDCKIVPILIGQVDLSQVYTIAQALEEYIDENTLIVVSSDFLHYGSMFSYEPFKTYDAIAQHIFALDSQVIEQIEHQDVSGFDKVLRDTGATICGRYPIMVLLSLLERGALGKVHPYVIGYTTSSIDQKNPEHSVSYASLVFSHEQVDGLPLQYRLTGYEKNFLLQLANHRLHQVVLGKKDAPLELPGVLTDALRKEQGCFVSLYRRQGGTKELRGCIGSLDGNKQPLYKNVATMTESAALHDIRFNPVQSKELSDISVSISVLTSLQDISSYKQIVLGKDGVILSVQDHSAVYLPQVAVEQKWNLEQMLSSLSQKAGLSTNAWKTEDVHFKVFQAIDF